MTEKEPTGRLERYCVVCGRTYGPALDVCCTAGSLVVTQTKGIIWKQRVYFTLAGRPLSSEELERLRVDQWNESLKKAKPTSGAGRLTHSKPASPQPAPLGNAQPTPNGPRDKRRTDDAREIAGSSDATFDVAISFAGADRPVAKLFADALEQVGVTVFYDDSDRDTLFGRNLPDYLAEVYSKRCKFCLMLVSPAYVAGDWTRFERQVAQATAIKSRREFLLLVRLDDVELPGQPDSIAWRDLRRETVSQIAESIRAKVVALADEPLPLSRGSESELLELQSDLQPNPAEERRIHNVHDAVLQSVGLAETRLIGYVEFPHRMQLEVSASALRRLRDLFLSGALAATTGVEWKGISSLNDVNRPPMARQVPLATLEPENVPTTLNAKQVVCHAKQIRGFEKESLDAFMHFGMVDQYTQDMTRLRAYVTLKGDCIYIESNYVKSGSRYPTKIATELKVDLLTLFVNLVFGRLPSPGELRIATLAHIYRAEYMVNAERLGPRSDDFYRGAMNIRFVEDPL
jgi:hypothetical protein